MGRDVSIPSLVLMKILPVAKLCLLFISQGNAQRSELDCENLYCRASGTVGLDNLTYPYSVPSNPDFDLVVTLTSRKGNVDLCVNRS